MLVLTKLPGKDSALLPSIQLIMLALAEAWSLEFRRKQPPKLYKSGIIYQPEPPGLPAEEWADPYTVADRRWGDCDDLVLYRLAEIFHESGYDPRTGTREGLPAWPQVMRALDGTKRYHIAIRHADGTEEDPALKLSPSGKVS